MNEVKALAGASQAFEFNGQTFQFKSPSTKWGLEFAEYIKGQMDVIKTGNLGSETGKIYDFMAQTLDKDRDWLLENIPMYKSPEFLNQWLDIIGFEVLRDFFIAGQVGMIQTIGEKLNRTATPSA